MNQDFILCLTEKINLKVKLSKSLTMSIFTQISSEFQIPTDQYIFKFQCDIN